MNHIEKHTLWILIASKFNPLFYTIFNSNTEEIKQSIAVFLVETKSLTKDTCWSSLAGGLKCDWNSYWDILYDLFH